MEWLKQIDPSLVLVMVFFALIMLYAGLVG